jgi:putative DNA primase/helicase
VKGFTVELELWKAEDGKGIDDLLAAGKQPGVLTGDEAVDGAVREIVAEADKTDATPAGPSVRADVVNEAYNDPHLLAREYRGKFARDGQETFYYHREEYHRWDGHAYRVVKDKDVKSELTTSVKAAFDRHNIRELAAWQTKGSKDNPPTAPKVTTSVLGNALQALAGMALLPWNIESPAWLFEEKEGWSAGNVLACRNALLHLPSLVAGAEHRIAPTPLFFSPNALDYDFDPAAPAPANWLAFLNDLWPRDQEAIDTLQEWFGYCLLPDTSQHKILMVVGPKRSGKGTIARVLRAVIGMQNRLSRKVGAAAQLVSGSWCVK